MEVMSIPGCMRRNCASSSVLLGALIAILIITLSASTITQNA